MKGQRVDMFVCPSATPADTSGLQALADAGKIKPDTLVALVGKTEGTGAHDDWGRVWADVALREAGDPARALQVLRKRKDLALVAAWQWAHVAEEYRIALLSGLDEDVVEELSAIPITSVDQVQRLVSGSASCLILPDAHKTLAVLDER